MLKLLLTCTLLIIWLIHMAVFTIGTNVSNHAGARLFPKQPILTRRRRSHLNVDSGVQFLPCLLFLSFGDASKDCLTCFPASPTSTSSLYRHVCDSNMIRSSPLPCQGTVTPAPPAECPDKQAPCPRLAFQVGRTTERLCSPRVKMSCGPCVSVFVCSVFLLHLTNSFAVLLQLPPHVQLASLSRSTHSRCLSLTGVSAPCLRMPPDVFGLPLHLSLLLISFHM